jgi:hypothetical protein
LLRRGFERAVAARALTMNVVFMLMVCGVVVVVVVVRLT